ncbi:LarC family nickel insertion protein [Paraglaciecola aquimarina]|uniref:LarC family nickel insertion protein n=1 Tax=Paraglaciecola algarum TaxID=3050085 RepID=A0ABS9D9M0_9ALTE|nr:LarC family nickel insertion protein [Paraglaciecola sp. G1-23]MCF2949619.1 LarC family nickel insertion protein [Paraglaciecola sp. G1-23]
MTKMTDNSHIHLDIVGGIAGDMFIGAMLDTFEPLKLDVFNAIEQVIPTSTGKAELCKGLNLGISGLKFSLKLANNSGEVKEHAHNNSSSQNHHSHNDNTHEHHHHHHYEHSATDQPHNHNNEHSHKTTYRYLCQLLSSANLPKNVAAVAVELLSIIAVAEAKIHNKTLDDVHFHELADWDSLMDVVAAAVILDALSACSWSISKLPLGKGLINTQHGFIPVPAPATAEILIGFEFFDDDIAGERITPTGAAILRYLKDKNLLIKQPQGRLMSTGYGLGTKVFPNMPNILRALNFAKNTEDNAFQGSLQGMIVIIEFDIDDMTGEELGLSLERIREQVGVVDVIAQTARGKKNRSVESVRLLASSEHYQDVIATCFNQTTTIGLRYRFETRAYLVREHNETQGVAYKQVSRPNGFLTRKIEHDELLSLDTLNQRRGLKAQVERLDQNIK